MKLKIPRPNTQGEGGAKRWGCPLCEFTTKHRSSYNGHYNAKHELTPRFLCEPCGAGFSKKCNLNSHKCTGTRVQHQKRPGRPLKFVDERLARPPTQEDQIMVLQETVRKMGCRIGELVVENLMLKQNNDESIPTAQHAPTVEPVFPPQPIPTLQPATIEFEPELEPALPETILPVASTALPGTGPALTGGDIVLSGPSQPRRSGRRSREEQKEEKENKIVALLNKENDHNLGLEQEWYRGKGRGIKVCNSILNYQLVRVLALL